MRAPESGPWKARVCSAHSGSEIFKFAPTSDNITLKFATSIYFVKASKIVVTKFRQKSNLNINKYSNFATYVSCDTSPLAVDRESLGSGYRPQV